MSNVLPFKPERRSTWAAKHLEFFAISHRWLADHLAGLSDEQFAVEAVELQRLTDAPSMGEAPPARFVSDAYAHEAVRRMQGVRA